MISACSFFGGGMEVQFRENFVGNVKKVLKFKIRSFFQASKPRKSQEMVLSFTVYCLFLEQISDWYWCRDMKVRLMVQQILQNSQDIKVKLLLCLNQRYGSKAVIKSGQTRGLKRLGACSGFFEGLDPDLIYLKCPSKLFFLKIYGPLFI